MIYFNRSVSIFVIHPVQLCLSIHVVSCLRQNSEHKLLKIGPTIIPNLNTRHQLLLYCNWACSMTCNVSYMAMYEIKNECIFDSEL